MPFDVLERSRWRGRPTHLFIFQRQMQISRFANAERPIELGGQTFVAAGMTRSNLRDSTESLKNNITIRFPYLTLTPPDGVYPATQALGDIWRPFPPSDRIFVSCLAYHRGDSDAAIEWTGRVIGPEFTDAECVLTCEPSNSTGRRSGQQKRWQRACWKQLYSQGDGMCNVDQALHAVPATLTGVEGLTLRSPAFVLPTGNLAGGMWVWTREDGLQDFRTIEAHAGDSIVVSYGATDLAPGLAGEAFPGCAHDWDACEDFDNTDNFGGAVYLPIKNPMGGQPVW